MYSDGRRRDVEAGRHRQQAEGEERAHGAEAELEFLKASAKLVAGTHLARDEAVQTGTQHSKTGGSASRTQA